MIRVNTVLMMMAMALLMLVATARAMDKGHDIQAARPAGYPSAYFAGGCFWCVESEIRRLDGVLFTQVGYMGGMLNNPKYEDTHDGTSGHAETVEVVFDPQKITYRRLVEFFLTQGHNPTELNRQGPDVGTQYRSAIFPVDGDQEKTARDVISQLTQQKHFKNPIVTQVESGQTFWRAEDAHQQYFEKYEERTGQEHPNLLAHEARTRNP